eukprot:Skav232751  [mRNA]  locus=scaffold757:35973:36929:+ [translate_table: standard]
MAALAGRSLPPTLTQVNAVNEGLKQLKAQKCQPRPSSSITSFGFRRLASTALLSGLVAFTRRRAKGKDDDPGGVQKWFEEKKAQGTAGVGGAVIGGMLAGPLGAVVGSQVASKLSPVLNDALDALEVEETDDAQTEKELKAKSKDGSPDSALPKKVQRPTGNESPQEVEDSTTFGEDSKGLQAPIATASSSTEPQETGALDELQQLRDSAAKKKEVLKAEIEDLYLKAEEALKAGDEASARELLEARSKSQKNLQRIMEGEERRSQQREDKLKALEEEAENFYKKAEKALKFGEDEMARQFLQERQKIIQQQQELQDS